MRVYMCRAGNKEISVVRSFFTSEVNRQSEAREKNSWGVWGAVRPPPNGVRDGAPKIFRLLPLNVTQMPNLHFKSDVHMIIECF